MLKYSKVIPITLFLVTAVFNVTFAILKLPDLFYVKLFYNVNEVFGSSVVLSVLLLWLCKHFDLPNYNRTSAVGLLYLNFINLVAINTGLNSSEYYGVIMLFSIAPVIAIVTTQFLKK